MTVFSPTGLTLLLVLMVAIVLACAMATIHTMVTVHRICMKHRDQPWVGFYVGANALLIICLVMCWRVLDWIFNSLPRVIA